MIKWKGSARKWSWAILRYYPSIYLEELRKAVESLSSQLAPGLRIEPDTF